MGYHLGNTTLIIGGNVLSTKKQSLLELFSPDLLHFDIAAVATRELKRRLLSSLYRFEQMWHINSNQTFLRQLSPDFSAF